MSRIEDGGAVEAGLVERLRARKKRFQSNHGNYLYYYGADAILDEHVAAEITRLRAENAGMREALEPFAAGARLFQSANDDYRIIADVTIGHFRRARAAISNSSQAEGQTR